MIKLTKKQAEIVAIVQEIEKETGKTVYFKYNDFSKKIHAAIIETDENGVVLGAESKAVLCSHSVAQTMEKKGIVVPEVVGQYKYYVNEDKLYDFTLTRLNYDMIGA